MALIIAIILFQTSLIIFAVFICFCILCWIFAPRHYVFCGVPQLAESRYSEWTHRNDSDRQNDSNDKVHQVLNELKEKGLVNQNTQVKIVRDWK